jgi:hypothetical protein
MGVATTRLILLTFNMFINFNFSHFYIHYTFLYTYIQFNYVTVPYNEARKTENKNFCEEINRIVKKKKLRNAAHINLLLFMREKKT